MAKSCIHKIYQTRVWANPQRDGRPAEYRRRPLFNAAKFGMPRSNTAKTRNPLKFVGVTQTRQQISAASRPTFIILRGHVEEISLLNKLFSDCRYMPYLRRYSPTKLWDGAQMATFWRFFACCIFSEPRAVRFRPAL